MVELEFIVATILLVQVASPPVIVCIPLVPQILPIVLGLIGRAGLRAVLVVALVYKREQGPVLVYLLMMTVNHNHVLWVLQVIGPVGVLVAVLLLVVLAL